MPGGWYSPRQPWLRGWHVDDRSVRGGGQPGRLSGGGSPQCACVPGAACDGGEITMEHSGTKPLIAITMGDPAGIGAEISLKALLDADIYALCRPLVLGTLGVL